MKTAETENIILRSALLFVKKGTFMLESVKPNIFKISKLKNAHPDSVASVSGGERIRMILFVIFVVFVVKSIFLYFSVRLMSTLIIH